MGQAKNRGTFEQRQQAAYDRIDGNIAIRRQEIEELDKFEQRQSSAMNTFVEAHVLPRLFNQRNPMAAALTRTDFIGSGLNEQIGALGERKADK